MEWKKIFQKFTVNTEEHFDRLKNQLTERIGGYDEIMILDRNIKDAQGHDSIWENLVASYKRMNSNELPNVTIKATFQHLEKELITDEEGYFTLELNSEIPFVTENSWQEIHLELTQVKGKKQDKVEAKGKILMPSTHSAFGIISDIDDTILQTKATEMTRAIQLTFMRNARTRLPFKGVSAFYQALQQGKSTDDYRPIFYVSSSPWNLYDFLKDFCEVRNIPEGVFFLRDLGISKEQFLQSSHGDHKLAQIQRIMQMYPAMPFILIGDSGQHDPEIYLQAIKDFPNRILSIYIRDVSENERDESVKKLVEEAQNLGVQMVFVKDTLEAGKHAVAQG